MFFRIPVPFTKINGNLNIMEIAGRDDDDYEEPVYDDGFETKYYLKVAHAQSRVSILLSVTLMGTTVYGLVRYTYFFEKRSN